MRMSLVMDGATIKTCVNDISIDVIIRILKNIMQYFEYFSGMPLLAISKNGNNFIHTDLCSCTLLYIFANLLMKAPPYHEFACHQTLHS